MNKLFIKSVFGLSFLATTIFSCTGSITETKELSQPKSDSRSQAHQLVYESVQKTAAYQQLLDKYDVSYSYTYITPDGKKDSITEKYIFNGELSYGKYHIHERNMSNYPGLIEQGWEGNQYWLKHNGELVTDSAALATVAFNRPTNFYWFALIPKLLDPGLIYTYKGEFDQEGKSYDVVKIEFESKGSGPTDIYQVYINKETKLIDQFLFTVVDYNVIEEPFLMQVAYEEVEGILIPTKRRYKKSNWDAEITDAPWISVIWSNISFNNGFTKTDFMP